LVCLLACLTNQTAQQQQQGKVKDQMMARQRHSRHPPVIGGVWNQVTKTDFGGNSTYNISFSFIIASRLEVKCERDDLCARQHFVEMGRGSGERMNCFCFSIF